MLYEKRDDLSYTIEYYYDEKRGDERTETVPAPYQDLIQTYTDKPLDDYVLDYVVGMPLTVSDKEPNIIKVYYALDKKNDEVPDKYQVKITYSAENGTIDSDHADKIFYVNLTGQLGNYLTAADGGVGIIQADQVGIGVGIQPIIGFNQGAGLNHRVKETFRKAICVATATSVVGWLGCLLFPAQILRLFGMSDPAYLEFGVRCMRVFLLGMLVAGFQVVSSQYYLATGQAIKALLLSILRPLLLMVPLIHIFSRIWGMDGILYASPTADYLTALIVALLLWHDRTKQTKRGVI